MKKYLMIILALVVLKTSTFGTLAQAQVETLSAQSLESSTTCVIPRLDGERVPFPLRFANTKFALAENETYLLNGTLVSISGKIYLKVDFNSQPWLATEKLVRFPYFPVDMKPSDAAQHSGHLVQIAVVARRNDVNASGGEMGKAPLKLSLILAPARLF